MRASALAVIVTSVLLCATACGAATDDTPTGGIAIGRNAADHPVAVLRVCDGGFDHIEIREMLGEGKSKVIGALETDHPVTDDASIDLVQPGAGWKASQPLEEASGLITASAWGAHHNSGASNQATFTFDDLTSLPAGTVISDLGPEASEAADGKAGPSMTLSAFKTDLCSRWGR